jgi:hypothetical protein
LLSIDTHEVLVATDHVQSRAVAIVSAALPPVAVNEEGELLAVTAHLAAVGAATEV